MNIEDYINKELTLVKTFINKYKNAKNIGESVSFSVVFTVSLTMFLSFIYFEGNSEISSTYLLMTFFMAFLSVFWGLLINYMFKVGKAYVSFEVYQLEDENWFYSLYTSKSKKEIMNSYEKIKNNTFSVMKRCLSNKKLNEIQFKYHIAELYISMYINLSNYKECIEYINKNFTQPEYFKNLSKSIFSYMSNNNSIYNKSKITDYIYYADINKQFKKYLLNELKQYYSEETIDKEIDELYNINKKEIKKMVQI